MATPHHSPQPQTTLIEDWVTYQVASALLARSGHKAPVATLRRYVRDDQLTTRRVGPRGTVEVSWSDILQAHRDRTAVKLRASSNWP